MDGIPIYKNGNKRRLLKKMTCNKLLEVDNMGNRVASQLET